MADASITDTTSTSAPSRPSPVTGATPETNASAQSDTAELDAAAVLATITVTNETPAGYTRALFDEWEHDPATGCTIRDTVVLAESITPATLTPGCVIAGGRWVSAYDNVTVTDASALDVDHLIPLKEAWDSGAAAWNPATRAAFANDITDTRTLIAVTASANRSKGDRDPSNWLPPNSSDVCTYISNWIAVKARWQLTMDPSEAGRLRNLIRDRCPALTIAPWPPATITLDTPNTAPQSPAPWPQELRRETPCTTQTAPQPRPPA